MIIVATSGANQCLYCVVAHGAILRVYEKKPQLADQVATNYRKADISERQRAILAFALKVCDHSEQIVEADFEALASTASTTKTSGISARSPRCLVCQTAWRT